MVNQERVPNWRALADAEGNEVDLASWGWAVSEDWQGIAGGLTRARRDDAKAGKT